MAAASQNVVPWQAVGVREALRDVAALWRDSVPARWPPSRRKAIADFAKAAELLQPCAHAFRSFLPPVALALAPNCVADKLLAVDAAAPSGFSLRQEWLMVDLGPRWADVRLDSVSAWARYNSLLSELIGFAGAPGVPPVQAPVGAPPADVVAQLAVLTEALAQQQRLHTEAMANLQAQLAAQEARAKEAAEKAAADAAQLLAGLLCGLAVKGNPVSGDAPAFSGSSLLIRLSPVVVKQGILSGFDLCVRPDSKFAEDEVPTWHLQLDDGAQGGYLLPGPIVSEGAGVPAAVFVQPGPHAPTDRDFFISGGAKRPWEGPLSAPRPRPFHSFMVAWDPDCLPCYESSFVHGAPVLGNCPAPVRWPPLLREIWSRTSLASLQSAGTSVQQWQEFVAELQNAGASVPPTTMHPCRMAAAFQSDPDSTFLVRGAACGVDFPFSPVPADTFYTVENYVADDQWSAMQKEIVKEKSAGNVVDVRKHWKAQGACVVGYLDDVLLIGKTRAETLEWMLLLREFVSFLGFTVNGDKCEGPFQCLEFLGVVLSTEGETCTASISEDRILTVQTKIAELKALWGLPGPMVPRSKMEGLLGLLAFCGQVVHGLSLYVHALLSVSGLRKSKFLHLTDKVIQDLKVVVQYDIRLLPTYISSKANVWSDLLSRDAEMTAIQELVVTRQMGALAKNTQTGYSTGIRSFVSFCISGRNHGFLAMMLPAKDEALAAWVVFMVEKRQVKPSTAKQYTSGVRALHLQLGMIWTPIRDRWQVSAALGGCARRWDTPSKQTMPIGMFELLRMSRVVCCVDFNEKVVFAAMCFAFFGFFRKDNVSVDKEEAWNPRAQFVRGLQQLVPDCNVRVRHSKTIQVQDTLIQAHGDWASDCFKLHCDLGPDQRLLLPSAMSEGAALATRHFFENGG
ncbi:hypothetical protein CYMTET_18818 [Cymbomonas tetramitiformis]|uniref:Reverse transcriptase domain-containing protein n=1 Tax=Cymbomonas tetramitiformis TaxID=36881 RepID=A0AAE0G7A2_9CHLO|nr:hypothetical protein CYMTET_18818 [Cymbomonas tetramitiformis]